MELIEYYNIIKDEIEAGNYSIKILTIKEDLNILSAHTEAIHYLLYEYSKYRNDNRINNIFSYVCIPTNETDKKFVKWNFDKFMKGLNNLKD
jgi:hypothetical protein